MMRQRKAGDRGAADHGWLDARHSFSFADYYDPAHVSFRSLRVLNEDRVQPGKGFGTHGHANMEILTFILAGALEHRDSLGTGSVIRPGDVQRMTAGTGVRHSEHEATGSLPVHLLQVWILPESEGLPPSYEERSFTDETRGRLCLVASRDAAEGSLTIHQDARVYQARLAPGERVSHALASGRGAWLHVATGEARVNAEALGAGDAAAIEGEPSISVEALSECEVLLFDLA